MTEIPHFALPFEYQNGAPVVNEQNSDADVAACVFAVCACEPGQLLDLPEFGLTDLTFEQEPINPIEIINPITRWEPRAPVLVETNPDAYDAAIVNAEIEMT